MNEDLNKIIYKQEYLEEDAVVDCINALSDEKDTYTKQSFDKVTRVEVIDGTKPFEDGGGRCYTFWSEYDTADKKDPKVSIVLQDDGKTLKVFID